MTQAKILIVDDVPENIGVLFEFLAERGFDVSIAPDGESALEVVEHGPPDLILLDVMMPGIDGFETCRRLKAQDRYRDIPVIFMTALSDTVDKVKGFQLGAIDYVTKPVQQEEVMGRINAHITIRRLQLSLQERNAEFEAFGHTVAHDLRNPIGLIDNAAQMLRRELADSASPAAGKYLDLISGTAGRMRDILEGLLLLAGLSRQQPVFEPLSMGPLVQDALVRLEHLRQERQAEIRQPEHWPQAYGHPSWVSEIWTNYLINALKYGASPQVIELGADDLGDYTRFWVKDQGAGLTAEQQSQLFVPFSRLHQGRGDGHGLGLSIVQRLTARLGGTVGVESRPSKGSLFYFTLPRHRPQH